MAIEKEKVDEDQKKKEDEVLRIEPAPGEPSKLGDKITIYIPDIEYKYPDFTEGFTLLQIEDFAEKHEIKLVVKYEENDSVKEGTILKQDRPKDSVVAPGATLIITVSRKPEPVETPEETPEDTGGTEDTGE